MADQLRDLLGADPLPWLLSAGKAYTRLTVRQELLGSVDHDAREADHRELLADEGIALLVEQLPEWGSGDFSGHHSPAFLPNRLNLLADMGVRGGDVPAVEELLDQLAAHQDKSGRFLSFGRAPGRKTPEWGSLLCDTNAITDVLLRFGRADTPQVRLAVERILADSSATPQGRGWKCVPEKRSLFRGPGRVNDTCPQVTLEGLRVLSQVTPTDRPAWLLDSARTPLEIWRRRTLERPYAFGHGYQFKSVKWPNFWYDVLWVLETVSRFPELWRGNDAREEDRRAVSELAACLIAYNFDTDGKVTPRRTYRDFQEFSFGQKKEPSPFATARALVPLHRMLDLAEEISAIDVEDLPGSRGGSGTPVPPAGSSRVCPTPTRIPRFEARRIVPRVLARHHVGTPHEPASAESIVSEVMALHSSYPITPYLALHARLPGFERDRFDTALYENHSLARVRCMRGSVFVVRHDLLQPVIAATSRPVIRHAREFARKRGVDPATYERFAPKVLEIISANPMTAAALRDRLDGPSFDVAALVNLMATESLVLRDRPAGGWRDRHWTYIPFADAHPDVKVGVMEEPAADLAVLRAYVRAYGPVTRRDAGWWTGIGTRRVERALAELGDEILDVEIEGADAGQLMHAADLDELSSVSLLQDPAVAFLPLLDPLMTGYARKDRFVDDGVRPYVFDRAGNATATILVNGEAVGVWDTQFDEEPALLYHLVGEVGGTVLEAVEAAAQAVASFIAGSDAQVRQVPDIVPLDVRGGGSVAHPLRWKPRSS